MLFSVVIHKDPGSDYGVTVPDLLGCFSAGSTVEEAISEVREAIECHIEGLFLENEPLPDVKDVEYHKAQDEYKDAYLWGVVDVDISKLAGKVKRVNITLPEKVLTRIDRVSSNRSKFLADAAFEYLANHSQAS